MKEILDIINKRPSLEELISCLDMIRINKDIVVIKFDGQRKELFYTVMITFDMNKNKPMIRFESSDLKEALVNLLMEYYKSDNN